jgi:hypothetical protein
MKIENLDLDGCVSIPSSRRESIVKSRTGGGANSRRSRRAEVADE